MYGDRGGQDTYAVDRREWRSKSSASYYALIRYRTSLFGKSIGTRTSEGSVGSTFSWTR